ALSIHERLAPLAKALFVESSPSPVKRALALAGQMTDIVRLPLVRLSDTANSLLTESVETFHASAAEA
ncbi:MAG: dihydrodipicolinate synthase family protein, partial [Oricola sp.]